MFVFIVLFLSLCMLYIGIASLGQLFICVINFWGETIWKNPARIEWKFRCSGMGLVSFVVGLAGMLWSVIVLAIKFAA